MNTYGVQSIVYTPPSTSGGSTSNVDPNQQELDFLQLLISETQDQDPDKPMDSTTMITQYAQMQASIGMEELNASSQNYQNSAIASSLMNQTVKVTIPSGVQGQPDNVITGKVEGVDFSGNAPTVTINGQSYPLSSVTHVGA